MALPARSDDRVAKNVFVVIRRGFGATATVEVRLPRGFKCRILFVKGGPIASDAVESTQPMTSERKGDLTIVKFGTDERYEIRNTFITGG